MEAIEKDFPYGHDDAQNLMSAGLKDDMTKWLNDNPKATFKEAEEAKEKIFGPLVTMQTQRALSGNSPTQNLTAEQYRKLRPGAKFLYNGKQLTKE